MEVPVRNEAFVGRTTELGQLQQMLADAVSSIPRLVLLAGEPGIGKSRLAGEIAHIAQDQGAVVAWGRCWEAGGAPAYWPWLQSLRTLIRDLDEDELGRLLGLGAADVAQILPEIKESLPDLAPPAAVDPEMARFRLFDAITGLLMRLGAERPVAIVLDDMHAAD